MEAYTHHPELLEELILHGMVHENSANSVSDIGERETEKKKKKKKERRRQPLSLARALARDALRAWEIGSTRQEKKRSVFILSLLELSYFNADQENKGACRLFSLFFRSSRLRLFL